MIQKTIRFAVIALLTFVSSQAATSLYRNGPDARALGMAGAVATTDSGLFTGVFANPSALGWNARPVLGATLWAGHVTGRLTLMDGSSTSLGETGLLPDVALAIPLHERVTLGLGATMESGSRASWRYRDQPGGADGGTSYGVRTHESELLLGRVTAGLGWEVSPEFSIGASVNLLWNRNRLRAPYIFQSQETLRTVKTLLDLKTEGWGVNAQIGTQWRPLDSITVGLAYRTEARIDTDGSATGDAQRQLDRLGLGAVRSDFRYDASVANTFPQAVTLGLEWKATDRLTLAAAMEWVHWSRTFDTLVVNLRDGSNADLNGLTGTDRLVDNIPLKWRDQWILRVGVEYALHEEWMLRAGYSWARSPVPTETLTPLTALLPEHSLNLGVGWKRGPWAVDLGYEWQLPERRSIGGSLLLAGEYENSSTRIGIHWVGLSIRREFGE